MDPFEEEVLDVVFDGKTAGAFDVVPVVVDASKRGAGPVLNIFMVIEEDVAKVVGVAFADVFDAEVVDD